MLLYELYDLKYKLSGADRITDGADHFKAKNRYHPGIFTTQTGSEKFKLKLDDLILLQVGRKLR